MYGGGDLGLVTSHNARPASAAPVRGFVGATVDCSTAHRDAYDEGPPGEVRLLNQRASDQWWLSTS